MLKFLENRTHEKPQKSPKKYKPQMIYGISVEAPQEFQTPYSIVHQNTYLNPYLNFEEKRTSKISPDKAKSLQPKWTHKNNLIQIQEQKIVSSVPEIIHNKINSRYIESYHNQLNRSQERFKLTKGQFTNFIEKNNHYKSIGPLHGQQRTEDRIMKTKQSVWFKPQSKRGRFLNSTMGGSIQKSESSFSKNSSLINQKQRIRLNREKLNKRFRQTIWERKKSNNSNNGFQLPKIGSEYIGQTFKDISVTTPSKIGEQQDGINQLELFEKNLSKKFK